MKLNEKLGSGDGNTISPKMSPKKVTPSSRQFSTKTLPNPTYKAKLQTAINEVSQSTSAVSRKKSLTLAEITPTRTSKNCKVTALGDTNTAGRRIYDILLLNAWRRCTKKHKLLIQSIHVIEDQNKKHELQIDALHRFRTSESEKRNEAVIQVQILHRQNEDNISENNRLLKDKSNVERDFKTLQQRSYGLQLQLQTLKNDLFLRQNELHKTEHHLVTEKKKITQLRQEKQTLIEQEFILKQEIDHYNFKVVDLREKILNVELLLQDNIYCKQNYEQEKDRLLKKLEVEKFRNQEIKEENYQLKFYLAILIKILKKRQNRSWWKNASEIGFAALDSLRSLSHRLFPSLQVH